MVEVPVPLEEIEQSVEVVEQPTEEGKVMEITVKKRKVSRRKGSREHVFEITETTSDDQPIAEVTVVELTADDVLVSEEKPKAEKKIVKKPKQLKKEEVEDYVINIIEEFVEQIPVEVVESEAEEVKEEVPYKSKKKPKKYTVTEQETSEIKVPEIVEEAPVQPVKDVPEEEIESTEFAIGIKEETAVDEKKQPKSKKVTKTKPVQQPTSEENQENLVKIKSEEYLKQEEQPEYEAVVSEVEDDKPLEEPTFQIEEIETEAIEREVIDDKGEITKQTVTKRKIKKQLGPKEEIIEILETKTGDIPEYEVIVTTQDAEIVDEEVPQEEKPKKTRKAKKVPKDDLHDYIQKLIEQDIPKTELEKYEKIDLDEPVKMKKKPVKKVKVSEEQPTVETEQPLEDKPLDEEDQSSEEENDEPLHAFTVKEFIPEKPEETTFEIVVLEETVETKQVPDEEGKIKEKVVKTKKIKQKKGPEEVVHEIVEVTDKDTNVSEITVITTSPKETPDQEEPVVKQKRTKKIKKDDVDDFIKAVIEEEAPKPAEPEDVVVVTEDSPSKPTPEKTKKKTKKEKQPVPEVENPKDDEISVVENIPEDAPVTDDLINVQESVPIMEEPDHEIDQVEETKKPEKKKKPKAKVTVQEEGPEEVLNEKPLDVTETESDVEKTDDQEFTISVKEEEKPEPKPERKKTPKKIVEEANQPSEEKYEIAITESILGPEEDRPFTIQVVESETKVEETTDDTGEVHKQVTTKRKLIRPDGEGEIEIIEVVRDDQPDAEITVVEYEPEPVVQEEKPKEPKKKTKKIKKDDIHDYIQKLIDMETPKTELEKYEKIEFEPTVKDKPSDQLIDVVEETPSEKPKKDKKTKPKPAPKEETAVPEQLAEVKVVEEEAPEQPVTPVEVVEIQPITVEIQEVVSEEGKPIQEKTTKRVLKKKGPREETTFKITTIENEDTDSVTVIVDEEPEEAPIQVVEEQPEQPEEKPKPKPKKTVKKVKKDELDDYVKKLIEEEIPKTELEKYEKVEIPEDRVKPTPSEIAPAEVKLDSTEPKPKVDDLAKPKKTKTKTPKPQTVEGDETIPDVPTDTTVDTTDTAEITPNQIAQPEDTTTAQITPSAQEEKPTQDDTKDTIQKTVKHKKTKPDTQKSVETSKLLEESFWSLQNPAAHAAPFAPMSVSFAFVYSY